jgi:hypothetical protein
LCDSLPPKPLTMYAVHKLCTSHIPVPPATYKLSFLVHKLCTSHIPVPPATYKLSFLLPTSLSEQWKRSFTSCPQLILSSELTHPLLPSL